VLCARPSLQVLLSRPCQQTYGTRWKFSDGTRMTAFCVRAAPLQRLIVTQVDPPKHGATPRYFAARPDPQYDRRWNAHSRSDSHSGWMQHALGQAIGSNLCYFNSTKAPVTIAFHKLIFSLSLCQTPFTQYSRSIPYSTNFDSITARVDSQSASVFA
jgi:hypothetical protein